MNYIIINMQTFPQFRNYQFFLKTVKRLTLFQYLLEWFELDFFKYRYMLYLHVCGSPQVIPM